MKYQGYVVASYPFPDDWWGLDGIWLDFQCYLGRNIGRKKKSKKLQNTYITQKCDIIIQSFSYIVKRLNKSLELLKSDLGEWEFAVKTTPDKVIKDSSQIKIPFVQIAGTNVQMLLEVLLNGFYLMVPSPKFQIPTKIDQIVKLRQTVRIVQHVMTKIPIAPTTSGYERLVPDNSHCMRPRKNEGISLPGARASM
ncbi:12708_t:CDS:2 [Entrophospora sp. SA101]|nr:12708_t:CDS:2 [Entrophospora sp. SA101]